MLRNISFYIKLLLLALLFTGNLNAIELSIIPLNKPILDEITKQKKLTQGIIRPRSKPIKKLEKLKLSKEITKPESKPSKKIEKKKLSKEITKPEPELSKKTVTKIIEKEIKKTAFLKPKSKPLTVKKSSTAKKQDQNFIIKKILILPNNLLKP